MITINLDNYIKDKFLGQGSYAEVYKVQEKQTKKFFAAKVLTNSPHNMSNARSLRREILNMVKLHHPSIINFFGFSELNFNKENRPTLIIEYLPNGSLRDILEIERHSLSPKEWNSTKKLINIYGIASGLSYLHSKNILHRDLKPENILMDEFLFPKIADFGLSKDLEDSSQSLASAPGTPKYIAPEIFHGEPYSFPIDVYSYAFVIYEIVTTNVPYGNDKLPQIYYKLTKKQRPPIDNTIPISYRNLIESCWKHEPNERPTFNDIVELLENDEGFLTPEIDTNEYYKYIDYIKNGYKSLNSMPFNQVNIDKESIYKIINKCQSSDEEESEKSDKIPEEKNGVKIEEKSDTMTEEKSDKIPEEKSGVKIEEKSDKIPEEKSGVKIEEKSDTMTEEKSDTLSGADLLKRMADEGDVESMFFYARLCYFGNDVPVDKEKAASYFQRAADLGHQSSMNFLGKMLFNGDGIPKDLEKSSHYFKQAADLGNLDAMNSYAILIYNGFAIEKNKKEAARIFKYASDQGNLKAMNNYANILYGGNGIPMNKREAAEYYQKAADLEYPPAMNNYANMLLVGDNVEKDEALALQYYEKAADLGFADAAYNYAVLLEKGELIHMDFDEVVRYMKIAADKNHTFACYRYGLYLKQRGQVEEANKYLKVAAEKNHKDAQFIYGKYLYNNDDKDLKEDGVNMLKKSSQNGCKKSDLFLYLHNIVKSKECNIC